jgi:hypothetical protein
VQNDDSGPADGSYDVRLILYDAEVGGSQVGDVVTVNGKNVSNGYFSAVLDFGAAVFNGEVRSPKPPDTTVATCSYCDRTLICRRVSW